MGADANDDDATRRRILGHPPPRRHIPGARLARSSLWANVRSRANGARRSRLTRSGCIAKRDGPWIVSSTARASLVSPPVALAFDVFARSVAEIGRADDEDLEALRPGLIPSPRAGRDAHRVPFLKLDDLVVDFHPPAPAHDHVHLLLLLVRVAVRKAIAGRDALVAQGRFLELERLGRRAELEVRRAVEPRADVLQILLDVAERERHGAILWRHSGTLAEARLLFSA